MEELGEGRVLPHQREVGRPAEQEDKIMLALADHLVGDTSIPLALWVNDTGGTEPHGSDGSCRRRTIARPAQHD